VYVSSPKNHGQPVGVLVDESVIKSGSGAVPEIMLEVKLAFGGFAAATGRIIIVSRVKRETHNTQRSTCTLILKTTPRQI